MAKAYFIEGIPGSGKTTNAKRLYDFLVEQGKSVELYNEGDLHPIDLAWCSITDKDTFTELTEKHSVYRDQILNHSKFIEDIVITAYTKVKVYDKDASFFDDFSPYEIYRTRDFQYFKDTHLTLWEEFNEKHNKDKIYIFECIFLQNHINELILKFGLKENEMFQYFQDMMNTLSDIDKEIIYISPKDVKQTFDSVIDERRSNNENYKDWIELVIEYFEKSKHGKKLGYIGYEGALKYFVERQRIEKQLLKKLSIKSYILELDADYDKLVQSMINIVK